jgi:hypothetical protein
MQRAALRAQREQVRREEEGRKGELERRRVMIEQAKAGVVFLDDPKHDLDFTELPVTPQPMELLDTNRKSLPKNLVASAPGGLLRRAMG